MNDFTALIPAYEPSMALAELIRGLLPHFRRVLVVDDGSRTAGAVFDELAGMPAVTLLRHAVNRGKGAALRTGFAHLQEDGRQVVVTVDADGQHLPEDALRVAEATRPGFMTLGTRTFRGDIPFRSRLGNLWTRGEFRLLTGRSVADTQSGLRGFPADLLPELLKIPGDRYEYEIASLVRLAKSGRVKTVPITTVYEPGNPTSHYRAFRDTLLTQSALIRAAIGPG